MNRTTRAAKVLLGLATLALLGFASLGLTPVQFTGTETNTQLMRIITLVVVPPSTEQLRGTNLTVQPNIILKPNLTNGYPLVSITSADYDVYVQGLTQNFRISVPDTNAVQLWYLLLKGGLTTYNYTNPLPILGGGVVINNIFSTNFYVTNLFASFITNLVDYSSNIFVTNLTVNVPGGFTNLNLVPMTVMYADISDRESSIPNTRGVLTNSGSTFGFSPTVSFDEIDALNFFPTNMFTGKTNFTVLGTDGNGLLILGVATTTLITTNFDATYITNLLEYTTNLFVTTNYVNTSFITNLFANTSYITNLSVTNLTVMTNNTFISYITNLFVTTNYTDTAYITNIFATNITANKITVNNLFSLSNFMDNVTVTNGLTNLSLTANTVIKAGAGKRLESIANSAGVLNNDGAGSFSWVANPPPGGSAGGELAGSYPNPSFAKLVVTNGENQTITVSNQFRVDATHAFVASNATASAVASFDGANNLTNVPNAHGVLTNTASGPASFGLLQNTELQNSGITVQGSSVPLGGSTLAAGSSPYFNGINFTNLGYGLPTNNVGGAAFVFGGPGTASTLYDTNISAATTLKLFDITACGATAGGIKIYVTCSGGTDRILTFPAGCSGAGLGTPPAVTITNAKAAFFDVIYKPGATAVTNVFWSPVF